MLLGTLKAEEAKHNIMESQPTNQPMDEFPNALSQPTIDSNEPIIQSTPSPKLMESQPTTDHILDELKDQIETKNDEIVSIEPLIQPTPKLMETEPTDQLLEDLTGQIETKEEVKQPVIEDTQFISYDSHATSGDAHATSDLLGDFGLSQPIETKADNNKSFIESTEILKDIPTESVITADLLADIQPATAELLQKESVVPLDPSLIHHVTSTSLEEHEQELAELMKETSAESMAQFDSYDTHATSGTTNNDEDDDIDMELEAVASKDKDEGDPWMLDEKEVTQFGSLISHTTSSTTEAAHSTSTPQEHAGESLVHLDSEELAAKDDISHCAVFGDEVEQDDLDLDEDERLRDPDSNSSGSSSSDGPDEEPVLLDLQKSDERKSSSSSSEEAIEVTGGQIKKGMY